MNDIFATKAARSAKTSKPLKALARLGFAVNGLLHVLIGALAIAVAVGSGGGDADQSGALQKLSESPGGVFILWTIFVGLVALGVWLLLSAFLLKGTGSRKKWAHRAVEVGKAVVYFALAGTAFVFARGGQTDSAGSASDASAQLLAAPGGVVVLFAIGLGVLFIGGYFVHKGATKSFTADISVPHGPVGHAVIALGVGGYIAKGIALGVVAILILAAAVTVDPSKSTGLDGALKTLAALPFGVVILSAVGLGLIAYGVYCFARSWCAKL